MPVFYELCYEHVINRGQINAFGLPGIKFKEGFPKIPIIYCHV